MQRLIFALGGLAIGIVTFGAGFVLTFPSGLAAERAGYELNQATDGGLILEAESLRPWRLSGAKAQDLHLYTVPQKRGRNAPEPVPNRVLSMDSAAARIKPFAALGGTYDVTLDGELYEGDLDGRVVVIGERLEVPELLLDGADLSRYPMDFGEVSVDAQGIVRLRVTSMIYDPSELDDAKGKLRLEVDGLVLDGLSFSGIDLPTSTFSESILSFTLDNGRARVKKGSFMADTLELEVDGDIELNKKLSRSRLNLELRLKLLDEALDGLAKIALGSSRDDAGVYHFEVGGTLERPAPRPKRFGANTSGRRNRAPGPSVGNLPGADLPGMKPPPDNPDENFRPLDREDPEARRQAREERIRQRREAMDARPAEPSPNELDDEYEDDEDYLDEEEDDFEDDEEYLDDEDFGDEAIEPIRDLPGIPDALPVPAPRPMADRDWPEAIPPDQD